MPQRDISVLFVCLGNICRSPTAEAVFRAKVKESGLNIEIDSAGTHGYHIGKSPDSRSQEVGESRGYDFSGIRCRRVEDDDFLKFDYILAMDQSNFDDLQEMSEPEAHERVHLFLSFANSDEKEVPDPYYGGRKGFEYVLDLIEQASDGLIDHIKNAE